MLAVARSARRIFYKEQGALAPRLEHGAWSPYSMRAGGERMVSGGARDSRAVCGDSPQTPDARVFRAVLRFGRSFETQRRRGGV